MHNNWSSADVLLPYLPAAFREYMERGELPGGRGSFPAAHRPWLHPEDFKRTDATPPGGRRRQAPPETGTRHAIIDLSARRRTRNSPY